MLPAHRDSKGVRRGRCRSAPVRCGPRGSPLASAFHPIANICLISETPIMRPTALLVFLLPLLGTCAPTAPINSPLSAPSKVDFHQAMEASLPGNVEGKAVALGHCYKVSELQCAPLSEGRSFRCTYRYGDGRHGTAIVERQSGGTFWRWVSGPKHCSLVTR